MTRNLRRMHVEALRVDSRGSKPKPYMVTLYNCGVSCWSLHKCSTKYHYYFNTL